MNSPKLRFKEFTDEWILTNLESISSNITAGKSKVSQNETQFYPILGSTGVIGYDDTYDYDGNFILIARVGANAGKITTYNGKCKITDNTIFFESTKSEKDFLIVLLESEDLSKKSFGSGQPLVKASDLKSLKILIPSLKEQFKIGAFFKKLNLKIQLQQEKIDLLKEQKKGYIQKIFSGELRFKNLDGKEFPKWKVIKLNNFASKIITKNKNLAVKNVISNSAKNGLISQKDFFDKEIANQENIDGYYVISNGDFVYNPRISNDAPYGPINIYKGTKDGIVSPLYMCFSVKDINKEYLYHYFKGTVWYKYIYMHGDSGARHDRVSIKDSTFLEMPILVPSIAEQNLIANFASTLQNKIDNEEKKLEVLLNQKQAFMQQMFV